MLQNEIKECFIELGQFLEQFSTENYTKNDTVKNNSLFWVLVEVQLVLV